MIDQLPDPPRRSRLDDEILEILEKADRPPSKPIALRSAADRTMWRARLRGRSWVTRGVNALGGGGWSVIIAGVALAVVANLVVEGVVPLLARILLYAAVAMIAVGFIQLFRGPGGSGIGGRGKLWRGRRVDLDRPGIDWDDKAEEWRRRR